MRFVAVALLFFCCSLPLRSEESPQQTALQMADDERVKAILSADTAKLGSLLSNELRYTHSNGNADTKTQFVEAIASGQLKYTQIDYIERAFSLPSPGIGLMHGRSKVRVATPNGPLEMTLSFLAVWREEQGQWRMLAWQSGRLAAPSVN